MKNLNNKTALVTGAANGIGAYFAKSLLEKGANVIACDIDEKKLKELFGQYENCKVEVLDVSEPKQWESVMANINSLDYLFNVAGVIRPGYIQDNLDADIELTIDVNLKGTMYGCRYAAIKMAASGGHIVNFASMAGIAPVQGLSVYTASKFGVRGFSLALAQELKPKNIAVSVVCPDATDTHMLDDQMDSEAAALTFSGKILTIEEVWKEVYKHVIIGKQIELWIPFNRGIQGYLGATFPKAAGWLTKLLTKKGLKSQAKFKSNRNK